MNDITNISEAIGTEINTITIDASEAPFNPLSYFDLEGAENLTESEKDSFIDGFEKACVLYEPEKVEARLFAKGFNAAIDFIEHGIMKTDLFRETID
ncbi:MAG: hypothetical protein FWC13_07610 [Oscillospiraceae bacterium]|nr:hypothetical protein [Oscillospiraceae bacterium]